MADLETKITGVTVYPDRARVTRRGTATLEAGEQTLMVTNLPQTMDTSSVRAAGKGNARLTGVQTVHLTLPETTPGAAKEALDKLQALTDQDKILADEQDAWTQRLA